MPTYKHTFFAIVVKFCLVAWMLHTSIYKWGATAIVHIVQYHKLESHIQVGGIKAKIILHWKTAKKGRGKTANLKYYWFLLFSHHKILYIITMSCCRVVMVYYWMPVHSLLYQAQIILKIHILYKFIWTAKYNIYPQLQTCIDMYHQFKLETWKVLVNCNNNLYNQP